MTLNEEDLVREVTTLQVQRLHRWIRLGWVRPERHEGAALFHEVDVARVRLLVDLEQQLEYDEDTVPMLLALVDQVRRHSEDELRTLIAPAQGTAR